MVDIIDLSEVNLGAFLLRLLIAFGIVLAGRWLAGLARKGAQRVLKKTTLTETLAALAVRVTYYSVLLLAVLVALAVVGVSTTSIVAVLGVIIILLGIALQESISNFAATVIFLLFQPFIVGELIETNGVVGTVREIALFQTVITKADNKLVTIANAQIQNNVLVNYSRMGILRADVSFDVPYGDDLRKAKRILAELLAADRRVLPDPPAAVVVQELGENGVELAVRPWVAAADYWMVQSDLKEQVILRFEAEGIEFPIPRSDVHVHYAPADEPISAPPAVRGADHS